MSLNADDAIDATVRPPENERSEDAEEEAELQGQLAANWKKKTAFINLKRYGLEEKTQTEILRAFVSENPDDLPEFLVKFRSTVKLVFSCEEQRDTFLTKKIKLFSQLLEVEPPRVALQFKRYTLHLTNIPIEVPHEEVGAWIKQKPEIQVVSEFRWVQLPNIPIKTDERTVVVQVPLNFNIPGFAWLKTKEMASRKKIRIWHYGMPKWCSHCLLIGHIKKECPTEFQVHQPQDPKSYAAAVSKKPAVIQEKQQRQPYKRASGLENKEGVNNYIPFFTFQHPFSNHFPSNFKTLNNTTYKTAEHFLFVHKAEAMGLPDVAKQIMEASHGGAAKRIGETFKWNPEKRNINGEKMGTWQEAAWKLLWQANSLKYEQNDELRKELFETWPKTLVEASPTDVYWGIGLSADDPNIGEKTKWRGKNIFGDLLTKLRDEMMKHPSYVNEAAANKGQKRQCQFTPPARERKLTK